MIFQYADQPDQAMRFRGRALAVRAFLFLVPLVLMTSTAATAASFDGPAELPRVFINTSTSVTPAPG
jgi:hypothetical protein